MRGCYLGYISTKENEAFDKGSILTTMGVKIKPTGVDTWDKIPDYCIRVIKINELLFGGEFVELVEVAKNEDDFFALLKKQEVKKRGEELEIFDLPQQIVGTPNIRILSIAY